MTGSAVELDFFSIQSQNPHSPDKKLFDRRRSFRDIQSVISKMNPEILKTVFESGSVNGGKSYEKDAGGGGGGTNLLPQNNRGFSVPSTPQFPAFVAPDFRRSFSFDDDTNRAGSTAPLTIFYNGTVAVFDVSPCQAQNIMKLANRGGSKAVAATIANQMPLTSNDQKQILDTLNGDLPIARKKSLQRFLEKRKERMTLVSPYACPTDNA